MDLSTGAVIAGRYRVDRKVGAGGMGEVWSGEHLAIGTRVALKTLLKAAVMNHEVVVRFKREAYLLGRIRSDHVARVVDFVADDEFGLVLVMDFIEGDSLARILMERHLTVEETIELAADVAAALVDLHRAHIVHRDLKPGNIILEPKKGPHRRAVVVDFGVSRLVQPGSDEETITGITRADMAVGTIEYMAPEQILNSRNVTGGSDLYALGAILFRALAGRHVFGATASDSELAQKKLTADAPQLPIARTDEAATGLRAVVARALKRRPSERYQKAEDMLADLVPLRDLARASKRGAKPTQEEQDLFDLETTTENGSTSMLPDHVSGPTPEPDATVADVRPPQLVAAPPPQAPAAKAAAAGEVSATLPAPQHGRGSMHSYTGEAAFAAPPSSGDSAFASPASHDGAQVPPSARELAQVEDHATISTSAEKKGISNAVALAGIAAALAAGVALGAIILQRGKPARSDLGTAHPAASASDAPMASAATTASAGPSAAASTDMTSPADSAAPNASAAPLAGSARVDPAASSGLTLDLDELPPANLPKPTPKPPPPNTASASTDAPVAVSAPTPIPSSKPTTTPSTSPNAANAATAAPKASSTASAGAKPTSAPSAQGPIKVDSPSVDDLK